MVWRANDRNPLVERFRSVLATLATSDPARPVH
jgi:hypothetical protein